MISLQPLKRASTPVHPADKWLILISAIRKLCHGPIYHIGKGVSAPVLIESQDPVYPESARQGKDRFDGTCLIRLVVDASGRPRGFHVIRALGPDFDANASTAVQQYRFKPAKRSGEPVAVSVTIEVNFKKY